ncbi:MAG: efflux RND transporter periplasmic adaptor subunit [candidate division KSB1 bacterium]|nr:efflux RND transporter periplasmic adaptor subunit [candidate division KSB1 bacterium]MDZ7366597.1 efflux RND transporter periplasmic adaptor subunit [candidate division KSB1 bacterium]MDZ7406685.1 efflux RND transporter periplasmic adaptor subunit [candidate division KSB1 bacterium]
MADSNAADLSKLRIDRSRDAETSTGSSISKYLLLFGSIIVAAGAIVLLFFRGPLASGVEVKTFTVTAISPSQADAVLTASGYVVAQRKAAVASKGTGRLEYLGVEEGDQVKAGQIIARLESSDVAAALAQARANLAAARARLPQSQADLQEATIQYERYKTLVAEQLVPRADFDAAEARYKRAVAAVVADSAAIRAALAAVRAAEVAVENTNIRAPFDGTVLTKNADVGEVVAPFGSATSARAAVVSIADMSSLEVEADVSESNIQRIKPGQPCEIVLDAYQDTRYPGVVSKIVPTADRAKATVLTKIKFVQRDERVLPEMSAKVTFLSQAAAESITRSAKKIVVSPAAIVTRGDQKVAFVVRDGSVTETPVEIAGTLGNLLEVRSGLAEGNQVVLNPPENMATGTRVKVANQ